MCVPCARFCDADYVRALTVADGLFLVTDPSNPGEMVGAGTGIRLWTF
jgi:hypothetical protein